MKADKLAGDNNALDVKTPYRSSVASARRVES